MNFLFLSLHISEVKCPPQLHVSYSFKLFCPDLQHPFVPATPSRPSLITHHVADLTAEPVFVYLPGFISSDTVVITK